MRPFAHLLALAALSAPLAGQVSLISGFNFGQFLFAGEPVVDYAGGSLPVAGRVPSNYGGMVVPGPEDGGSFKIANGVDGTFVAGRSFLYFDGTNGSDAFDPFGGAAPGAVTVNELAALDATNAQTVVPTIQMYSGDDNNAGLRFVNSGTTIDTFSIVTDTTGYSDYAAGQIPADTNFSFAAFATSTAGSVEFLFGGTSLGTFSVQPGNFQAFSFDLPEEFYGESEVTLLARVTGSLVFDHIQINGFFGTVGPPALTFWKGGAGSWSLALTPENWTDEAATESGVWAGGEATFAGTAGTVTVDNTDGQVTFTGIRFRADGYTVDGQAISTATSATPIAVGDGAGGGAAMTAVISAPIIGTGGLDKTEPGTLELSGANTYSGATAVSAGTLRINGDNSGATGAVTVASGATLGGTGSLGGTVTVQDGGTLAGASGSTLTMNGLVLGAASNLNVSLGAPSTTGLFLVNGALTLDGVLNVNAAPGFANGTYRLIDYTGALTNNTLAIGSVPGSPSDFTVQTGTTGQVNLLTDISALFWSGGNGTWSTGGAGWETVTETPATWSPQFATFQKTAGTVTVDDAGGPVVVKGAQFAQTGYIVTGDALTVNAASTECRVGDGTAAGAAMIATISAPITGTGGINKRDEGTLVLAGANTYSGGTTVTEGTLSIGGGGTTGSVTGNITNSGTVVFNRSDAITFAGNISGSGELRQQGAGTTTLTGTNSHTGGTTVAAGTLSIGGGGTAGSITGNITNNATVVFNRSDAVTFAGNISGSGELRQQGGGTLTLTGTATHEGGTTVAAGTLAIGGTAGSVAGDIANSGTVVFNRTNAYTHAGVISGTGAVAKQGTGTTTLTGANTYTGTTTVSGGKLIVSGDQSAATGAVSVAANATLGGTGTLGGVVTIQNGGALEGRSGETLTVGGLVLNSSANVNVTLGAPSTTQIFRVNGDLTLDGTLNLTATTGYAEGLYRLFAYTGALTDNTLVLGSAPSSAASYQIQTSVAQQVNLVFAPASLPIWNDSASVWSVDPAVGGWETVDGSESGGWQPGLAIFQGDGGIITVDAGAGDIAVRGIQFAADDYTIEGDEIVVNTPNAAFRVGDGTDAGAGYTGTITSAISGTGGINKTDLGTLVLGGENTYRGATRLSGGVLEVSSDANLGDAASPLRFNGGTLRAADDLTLNRPVTVAAAGGTVDTGANVVALSGGISGSGALTKTGAGVLTVTGDNLLSGATTVTAGALNLNGSLGSVAVQAGARLTGNGNVRGNLANAGQLSPGSSPGTVTVTGNFTQSATGNYVAELASATSFDRVVVTGSATLAGNLTVSAIGSFVPSPGQNFKIIEAAGGVNGTFARVISPWEDFSAMLRFRARYNPTDVTIGFEQLPFAGLSGSDNQQALGAALDAAIAQGRVTSLRSTLNAFRTEDEVKAALAQLSPLAYLRWFDQALFSTSALVRTAETRFVEHVGEARGGLWAEVVRRQSDFDAEGGLQKTTADTNGIVVGAEMAATPHLQAGVLVGYTDETIELDEQGSVTAAERFSGAVYGRYAGTRGFVEGVVGATYAELTGSRQVAITGAAATAESDTDSNETFAALRAGVHVPVGRVRLTPYLGVQHTSWSAADFNEMGAGDAGLRIAEQKVDSLATRIGLMTSFSVKAPGVTITPRIDVAWRYEFRDDLRTLVAELGGQEFLLTGPERDATGGVIASIGIDATFESGLTAYARLTTERRTAAAEAFEAKGGIDFRF